MQEDYTWTTEYRPAGSFVGRGVEQERFREMLLDMAGTRKGFMSGLLGGGRDRPAKTDRPVKSRVALVAGPPGSGKTRLSLRLREIAQKEKSFAGRFRTLRLDWNEAFERDQRLGAVLRDEVVSPEILLDLLYNHLNRENGGGYLEEYRHALETTRQLARTVQGAELQAVWEYRARALGNGLREWSGERYLLWLMDNFERVEGAFESVFQPLLEAAGSRVFFALAGERLPAALPGLLAPDRLAELRPAAFSLDELRSFLELELARYSVAAPSGPDEEYHLLNSPETLGRLLRATGGLPLAARLTAYLLQSGMSARELPSLEIEEPDRQLAALAQALIGGPLGSGHPDRLKLYALTMLRRPEKGVVAAMFDVRKDMLSVDEVLDRFNERYAFLFEPGRPMTLHAGIHRPLRNWLLAKEPRPGGEAVARLAERALAYLASRLAEWSVNFPTLAGRVTDLKWREWALDQVWYAFWQAEDQGWPYALALLTAGLGYRPDLARQVVSLLEQLEELGLLSEAGRSHQAGFRAVALDPAGSRQALRELRVMGEDGGYFQAAMPGFENELRAIIGRLL